MNTIEETQAGRPEQQLAQRKTAILQSSRLGDQAPDFLAPFSLSLHSWDPHQGLCLRVQSRFLGPRPSAPGPAPTDSGPAPSQALCYHSRPRPADLGPAPSPHCLGPAHRFGPAPPARHIDPSAEVARFWSWSWVALSTLPSLWRFLPWLHPSGLANSSRGVLFVAGR